MDIFDVRGLLVTDLNGKILYKKVFNIDDSHLKEISAKSSSQEDPIFVYRDYIIFMVKKGEFQILLVADPDRNEIFLYRCLNEYGKAFEKVLKKCKVDTLWKKYDLIILLSDSFVYQGIIVEDNCEKLVKNIPKRPFESVEGMKVPKGMASLINNATKSLGRNRTAQPSKIKIIPHTKRQSTYKQEAEPDCRASVIYDRYIKRGEGFVVLDRGSVKKTSVNSSILSNMIQKTRNKYSYTIQGPDCKHIIDKEKVFENTNDFVSVVLKALRDFASFKKQFADLEWMKIVKKFLSYLWKHIKQHVHFTINAYWLFSKAIGAKILDLIHSSLLSFFSRN